jgi:hypothetical protein
MWKLNSNKEIKNERYLELVLWCYERHLGTLWIYLEDDYPNFFERCNAFFEILERLIRDGRIKLHKNGVFLNNSIEVQIELFKKAFPKDEHDADRICTKPGMEAPYEGFGMNVWWFLDSCPAGVAWRQADGHYEIAA